MKRWTLPGLLAISLTAATFHVSTPTQLRQALQSAATNGEADTILLAPGIYRTTDGNATFEYLSNEEYNLTLRGADPATTILSGEHTHRILKHTSTKKATMILERLTFKDGNSSHYNKGGGVYSDYDLIVKDCNFTGNHSYQGGGIYVTPYYTSIIVMNSTFTDNDASEGGGFYTDNATVTDSTFTHNNAGSGGGFYAWRATVTDSFFTSNNANVSGGFFTWYYTPVTNSIFTNNSAGCYVGDGSIHASNLLMIGNEKGGIAIRNGKNSTIYNSIFLQNGEYDIKIANDAILAHLDHNYIDLSKVLGSHFAKENIFGMDPGFVDEATGDYHLCGDSPLVDAGTTELEGLQLPQKDMDGNARVAGASIDIGPYEYSTTRPTILDVRVLGEPKEGHKITLQVDYSLAKGRSLASITYDYKGDGTFVPEASHIYDKPGTYEIAVKVTDDAGEFSIKKITLTIQKEDLRDKLAKILTPEQIEQVLPIIEQEKEVALQNALPIQQPKSDTAAILDQIAGKPLPIKGYYLHYGTGLFAWIYVPHSLKNAYKLERGIRSGYRLVWTRFPDGTHIEKIGESIVLTPTQ